MLDSVQHLGWFVVAGVLLNLTPGPDLLYILGHALRRQPRAWRAGVWATLGIIVGCLVHVAVAAVGLGALIAASATAFGVLKWLGALYLVYLGVRSWRAASATLAVDAPAATAALPPAAAVFWRGLLTNLLNPKVVLFFLAFLPPFVPAGSPAKTLSFLLLGAWFVVQGGLFLALLVLLAARLSRLGAPGPARRLLEAAGGVVFLALALRVLRERAAPA